MESPIQIIYTAVLDGKDEAAADGVRAALDAGVKVDTILHQALIAAMDVVGQRFADGEMFIPQVLWSARAMQAGMDLLKPLFSPDDRQSRGKIIIGTAQGDIHDIGKNLVAMMLEGAGFDVLDLGVDVPPERFVDTAEKEQGDIIAVSALLTTTMYGMADIVDLLAKKGLSRVRVLVGGAPVDKAFQEEIGAAAYGVDAVDAVRQAKGLLGRG